MDGDAALLGRYRPVMQYDSRERYFADHASAIADRPGNELIDRDGHVIATATTERGLLELLRPGQYAGHERTATNADRIRETGCDYAAQAAAMHAFPQYAHWVHGRLVPDGTGTRWLQYWFFMYYNDRGVGRIGIHEGDLEMIQLALGEDDVPAEAVYAQHRTGQRVSWDLVDREMTTDGPAPVVYTALGSHASLLRPGRQRAGSMLADDNDARGDRVRPRLVMLSETRTPWAYWPGSWGATRAPHERLGRLGLEANSPGSPVWHPAWSGPLLFARGCRTPELTQPALSPRSSAVA